MPDAPPSRKGVRRGIRREMGKLTRSGILKGMIKAYGGDEGKYEPDMLKSLCPARGSEQS